MLAMCDECVRACAMAFDPAHPQPCRALATLKTDACRECYMQCMCTALSSDTMLAYVLTKTLYDGERDVMETGLE